MAAPRRAHTAAAIAVAIAIAGCGGNSSSTTLDSSQSLRVAKAETRLATFCVEETDADAGADTASYTSALDAIDQLIRTYREHPDRTYQPGNEGNQRTLRQVLSDRAAALEGCNADMARLLDRALNAGP